MVRSRSKVVTHGPRDAPSSQPHALVCPSLCTHTQTHMALSSPSAKVSSGFRFPRVLHSLKQFDASWRLWLASLSACWREDFLRLTWLTPFCSVFLPCHSFSPQLSQVLGERVLVSAGLWNVTLKFFFKELVNKLKQVERIY